MSTSPGVRIARLASVEVHLQRDVAATAASPSPPPSAGVAGAAREADPPDVAAHDVRVEELAVRAELEIHGEVAACANACLVAGSGRPFAPARSDPDALARVVGEEQRAVVGVREAARRGREGDAREGRALLLLAVLPGHDLLAVAVGPVRRRSRRPRAYRLSHRFRSSVLSISCVLRDRSRRWS